MSNTSQNIWYNFAGTPYDSDEEEFLSKKDYTWITEIEKSAAKIEKEVSTLIKEHSDLFKEYRLKTLNPEANWQTISLKTWGVNVNKNLEKCSFISNLLNEQSEILSFAVSRLKANAKIGAHIGDTNAIYRCHLGIQIPSSLPDAGIRVRGEKSSWEKHKVLAFCDAYEHEAWNNTEQDRIIVIYDVLKPQFKDKRSSVCFKVRAFMLFQVLLEKTPFMKKLLMWCSRPIIWVISILLRVIWPYQKRKGVIIKH